MKRCIVIADDDPTIISLVSLRLGMARFNIVSATNGEDALQLIRTHDPVAAVLDVQMPRKTGLEVLSALKADPNTSKLPVMMLTGERSTDIVLQAMGGGADDYMVKPFDPETLLDRVSRLVRAGMLARAQEVHAPSAVLPPAAVAPSAAAPSAVVWEL